MFPSNSRSLKLSTILVSTISHQRKDIALWDRAAAVKGQKDGIEEGSEGRDELESFSCI